MRAIRSAPPGVSVVDIEEPDGPGELVTIASASICASDLNYIRWGSNYVLGHELAGITEDGRAVAIEAIFGCRDCEYCDRGDYNLCASTSTTALGIMANGGMSPRFRVPSASLVDLPAGLSASDGSLVEPASVAWHAARLAAVGPDQRVCIVGGGAIGLIAIAAAQAMGAAEVSLEARYPHQIEVGERLGASAPKGLYDVVIEAAGSGSAFQRAAELAAPRGAVAVLGAYEPADVPQIQLFMKEIHTVPSLGYSHHAGGRDFDDAASLLASHPELVDSLITHRFPLEDAVEAFRVAGDKSTGALRVVIDPSA